MALILRFAASLALLFLAPGLALLAFLRRRRASAPAGLTPLVELFLAALVSVCAASWTGLILAELSIFSLRALLASLGLASAVLFILAARGRAARRPWRPSRRGVAVIILFALLGLVFYRPPHEYILGNWDPGTYVNAGARLARRGSIVFRDELLASLSPSDRRLFYYTHLIPQRYEGGMAIADEEKAIVAPHFYYLYTMWMGIFHAAGGVRWALRANALFALLSLAAVFLATGELAGARAGLLTALLLAMSPAEIWNARFPTSEVLTQFYFWSGLFCLFRYERTRDEASTRAGSWAWALLAGFSFAEALLTRISAVAVLPALALLVFWWSWDGSRRGCFFFSAPLAAALLHLAVQNATVCRSYVARQVEVIRSEGIAPAHMIAWAAVFVAALAAVRLFAPRAREAMRRLFGHAAFRAALALLVAGLFVFAYHVRPSVSDSADARNLRELAWFVYPLSAGGPQLPIGLYIALAGVILFIRDGFDERRGTFFVIVLPVALLFLYRKMIFPSYLWAVRRYVPLVLPALLFFMSFALSRLAARGRAAAIAAGLIVFLLLGETHYRYVSRLLAPEFAGTADFLDELAAGLDRRGVYVCEGSGVAAPLDFIYGLDVLQLSAQNPEKCRGVERVMRRWIEEGRRVYYISRGGRPISRSLGFTPLREIPFETDYLEHSVGRFPARRRQVQIVSRLFRVTPLGEERGGGAGRRLIDIGEDSFGLMRGFHGLVRLWEREGGRSVQRWARWTSGEAAVLIPTFGGGRDLEVTLRASAGRARPDAPVRVVLGVNGRKAAFVEAGSEMKDLSATIPASLLPEGKERAALTITAPTWNPKEAGLEGYPPDLGICIERVLVKEADDRVHPG